MTDVLYREDVRYREDVPYRAVLCREDAPCREDVPEDVPYHEPRCEDVPYRDLRWFPVCLRPRSPYFNVARGEDVEAYGTQSGHTFRGACAPSSAQSNIEIGGAGAVTAG